MRSHTYIFLDFFCKTKKMIYIGYIRFLGALQKNVLVLHFTDITKVIILFHLQRLGAERHKASFLNY